MTQPLDERRCRDWIPQGAVGRLAAACCWFVASVAAAQSLPVELAADGLHYAKDERGNRVPDFSNCGYAGGDSEIPDIATSIQLAPAEGDDGQRIQAAIDEASRRPADKRGFRGAVVLLPGRFEVAGQIRIAASGVVLRGSGATDDGTTLVATGGDRRPLIRVMGRYDRQLGDEAEIRVVDDYVPVSGKQLHVTPQARLRPGDEVLIVRPSTAEWIAEIGMDSPVLRWKPGTRDIRWDRTIAKVDNGRIELDAPITTALESRLGGATVHRYDWPSRVSRVGVEDLRMASEHDSDNRMSEDHAWFGVVVENAKDVWIRRIGFEGFAGGAVLLRETASRATVVDCTSRRPASELAGYRRQTFFTQGQQTLCLRCWSEDGRHDFSVGHGSAGPNAFVQCFAKRAHESSGPIGSLASGVLYDNVRIEGGGLHLDNRWNSPPQTGWTSANCMLWQCQADEMRCFTPPGAANWIVGFWATPAGDAEFHASSDFVQPRSLFREQLRQRLGSAAAQRVDPILLDPVSSTSPTIEEAAAFAASSDRSPRTLLDVIQDNMRRAAAAAPPPDAIQSSTKQATESHGVGSASISVEPTNGGAPPAGEAKPLKVTNGWIVADGELVVGDRFDPTWWRGTVRPDEAASFGPSITRYVPGRIGEGLTDDLQAVVEKMQGAGFAAYDHHYGLWYDRRRDDHMMVRRGDADVAPPFFEQPFARSGVGVAWDGMSKYDLTRFNPWYWDRLRTFARLCDERRLVLLHHNYFQHNILEAGAHWADCPWRPANNVNATGLPEPPPYVGDKRIFVAHRFYDVSNPKLKALHERYIRQCLDNFADRSNVVQLASAEYTGPLAFMQFWIDTMVQWQRDRRRDAMIALSCTKDVQDKILADPVRASHIDVIDIRYWTYQRNGSLYAPLGGANMAPRQHARQIDAEPSSFASIVMAVREYAKGFPDKAVIYNSDRYCRSGRDGWAVLMGGGSLANVPLIEPVRRSVATMRPVGDTAPTTRQWRLANDQGAALVYVQDIGASITVELPANEAEYRGAWIDAKSGQIVQEATLHGSGATSIPAQSNVLWIRPAAND